MDKYRIGDLVSAKLGTLPVVGTVVKADHRMEKYLVRFSAVQQNWYTEEELVPYHPGSRGGTDPASFGKHPAPAWTAPEKRAADKGPPDAEKQGCIRGPCRVREKEGTPRLRPQGRGGSAAMDQPRSARPAR